MPDAAKVSRSEAIKGLVLERITNHGGRVEGQNLFEIREILGLDGVAIRVLKSALWKLVDERKLTYHGVRDLEVGDLRGFPSVCSRIYAVRR
ncbi:hypothetical protein H6800_00875 [Candidatus Nomurabacteria bacterium]|nr:hypothetical protein [Candidatus Nomurabacteria bacterium]